MRCRFITFEGIDGSGKSCVAEAVVNNLLDKGLDVVFTTEPTRTWLGDAVKRSYTEDVSVFTEALLFMADRATHTEQIKNWVEGGKIVVSDRYADSTYAYQAVRLKELVPDVMNWLIDFSRPFVVEPDLTLLLDVDPEVGLARIGSRDKKVHFENASFLRDVRANYLHLAKSKKFIVIDASKPLEEVIKMALEIISSRVAERDTPPRSQARQ